MVRSLYLASLAGVAGLAAWRWASLLHLMAATLAAGCVGAVLMRLAYVWLEASVVQRGLDQLVAGLVFFLLAALVSLAKAGLVRRAWVWCLRHRAKVERLRPLEAGA